MHPIATPCVGVDLAQASLALSGCSAATVENRPPARRTGLRRLPARAHFVCEATGRHHHLLQNLCAHYAIPDSPQEKAA